MGLGAQLTRWPDAFVERLASHGFRVIRFDNRDVGLDKHDAAGLPNFRPCLEALREGRAPTCPTLLDDMAADVVGLLDALGIERAHIVGGSLGGMIAQLRGDGMIRTDALAHLDHVEDRHSFAAGGLREVAARLGDRAPIPSPTSRATSTMG